MMDKRFPYSSQVFLPGSQGLQGQSWPAQAIIEAGRKFVTAERFKKLQKVSSLRSCSLITVLEGVCDRGNINAVMRTIENLGLQEMHIIQRDQPMKDSQRVTQGAEKWLTIRQWDAPGPCLQELKNRGFTVVATGTGQEATPLDELALAGPLALIFGNERDGVAPEVQEAADQMATIPTRGLSQSLNISVASAIALDRLQRRAQQESPHDWFLAGPQQERLLAQWLLQSIGPRPLVKVLSH